MVSKTASMNADGTASWNRSDMELTNTSRRPPPRQRLAERRLVDRHRKPLPIFLQAHGSQAPGHAFRIAVLAPVANLGAARHRVPGGFGPFDCGAGGHGYRCSRIYLAIPFAGPIPRACPTQNRNSNNAEFLEFFSGLDFSRNLLPNKSESLFL